MVALAVEVMADAALSKPERIYIATGDSLTVPLLDKLSKKQLNFLIFIDKDVHIWFYYFIKFL
jgi:hypothetical protein